MLNRNMKGKNCPTKKALTINGELKCQLTQPVVLLLREKSIVNVFVYTNMTYLFKSLDLTINVNIRSVTRKCLTNRVPI